MYLQTLLIVSCSSVVWTLYQDISDPYEPGPLAIDRVVYSPPLMPLNPPPMQSTVYFPTTDGEYAVLYFVTGFYGVNPGSIYEDMLSNISTHGYVVIANWPILGDDGADLSYESHLENLDWHMENLEADTDGAIPSFDDVSVGCHSSGCLQTLFMALNRTDQIKALLNLEPVHWAIVNNQPEHYLPTLNYGAELANVSCSYTGMDFETWHEYLECPKIMMEAAGVGHCDFLDYETWEVCSEGGICPTGEEDQLTEYRAFVSGISSAFMTGYVQGNVDQLEYITDVENIPWPLLQHDVDIDC